MKTKYTFEILCLDASGTSVIKSEENLTYSLLANHELWINPNKRDNSIIDDKQNISLNIKQLSKEEESDLNVKNTFLIRIKGDFDPMEQFRIKIVKYLNNQGYNQIYILLDEVSSEISCRIYPKINLVENLLRKYVMKFFITKLGPSWWNVTADSEMKKKVNTRKNNETFFSGYIDNKAFLIDFGELGKIVHSQSSGFISREDIVSKVLGLEESPAAIKNLKKELESNYTKFFQDTFKEKGFQTKWEDLEKIRHKVAHNNLFTRIDLNNADTLTKELEEIITNANSKIDGITFSIDEKVTIQENIASTFATYQVISEETFLEKLTDSERWALKTRDNFISLKHFVTNYLGAQGYDYRTSYDMVNVLEQKGLIELYEFTSSNNLYPITAIRKVKAVA
jgi:hypothetical protein